MSMTTYLFLIPIESDPDVAGARVPHPADLVDRWERSLSGQFGAFSRFAEVPGIWTDALGKPVPDKSRGYMVGIDPAREAELRDFVRAACGVFSQQCIFLLKVGIAELVFP